MAYVAAAEHFPTTSRNLAVGYGASCGRLGSILAPLVRLTSAPSAILGGIGATAALAALALPETAGDELPETLAASARGGKTKDVARSGSEREDARPLVESVA